MNARRTVAAVIVTRNRPALLQRCLLAISAQDTAPDMTIVVDNASDLPVRGVVQQHATVTLLALSQNHGPAAAFGAGIRLALANDVQFVWMMDDDGLPAGPDCLAGLLATAARSAAHLTSPLVRDVADPARLAFPIRQRGRTRFDASALCGPTLIEGFAHLFNGALVTRETFERIGYPEPRLFIRGDEVEFMLRAKRCGLRIVTDRAVAFLHPASDSEIHPILGGNLYAVVPADAAKRFYQFRNRGWIFSRYGMWGWLAADHVRYALYYFMRARDPAGYAAWLHATWLGVRGRLHGDVAAVATTDVLEHAT